MNRRLPILLLPLAMLSACKDSAPNDRRTASGEVLEGTISDGMLPLDTLQSQPPLMKSEPKKPAAGDVSKPDEAATAEGAAADAPAEDPAAPAN